MNPWTALLESLHSALIDELNERLPDEKPVLGMPIRQSFFALPAPALDAVICSVKLSGGTPGISLIAVDGSFKKKIQLDASSLWQALFKRAGSEFLRRGIKPIAGSPEVVQNGALPTQFPSPGRVIWMSFGIAQGICFLGVGV